MTDQGAHARTGPLAGYRILEMAGIGPGPFAAMMLADMGAEVIRVDRKTPGFLGGGGTVVDRGRRSMALDLKAPGAIDVLLRLVSRCDALIEGYRPGVMERLGLGPERCLGINPRLVYGRMTGWGQDGPLSQAAGHDLNYIALTGVLHAMGHADRPPTPPLHLVGDLGGGGMMLAFGLVCALLETARSGRGQVIDAAICDGVSTLANAYHGMLSSGRWVNLRESNMLDGGAHFYGCYECADGRYVSVGSIEPQFYALLCRLCELDDPAFEQQWDRAAWPQLREKLAAVFRRRTRDAWCALLEGTDVCFAPVLDFEEARAHPHYVARSGFVQSGEFTHPAPSPRFSRTPGQAGPVPVTGSDTATLLAELGFGPEQVDGLRRDGAIH
ncbi:CaiB/BaiF CoA transferase family protein [Bordetella genomosp. 13]|uniref:CaiB/BaiF CoA transferase family protein n=1 Tax=Bordetella genomosp. 13 TaxID=463040 RepID=UPI00119F4924|nr:CaiB/BaiF CoA-transferase family protein [Bordetella genomosp. 13]